MILLDGRKEMQRPGKIEVVKKKIHSREKKVFQYGIGNYVSAGSGEREVIGGSPKKFTGNEKTSERKIKLLETGSSTELLQRNNVVDVKSKVIFASLLKIEGRRTLVETES